MRIKKVTVSDVEIGNWKWTIKWFAKERLWSNAENDGC